MNRPRDDPRAPDAGRPSPVRAMLQRLRIGTFRAEGSRLLDANPALIALLGYESLDEIRTIPVAALFPGPEAYPDLVSRLAGGETVTDVELEMLRGDGTRELVSLTAGLEPGGEILEAVVEDVGQRRTAAQRLRASEAELEALFTAMTDVILVIDREGRYLKVAPTNTAALVRPPDELLGHTIHDFFPRSTADIFLRYIAEALETRSPVQAEYRIEVEQGDRWFDATISPMLEDSVVWVARDVTAHKQMQDQLQQAVKMEAVGRLAGGIAHDFNNLLTAILGTSALVLDELAGTDPHQEDLLEIRRAAERAGGLTRQLLAFSRRQVLQPRVIEVNGIVRTVDTLLLRLLGEDVQRRKSLAPDLGLVRADPGQLEQVIVNLALNARDAMPEGGVLTIETANVELGGQKFAGFTAIPGPYVRLSVRDTGSGISPRVRLHLFEPFFTTKERGKGTGLGLATVYGIVKQSGGYIDVASEEGKGSTFHIYLPKVEGPLDPPLDVPQAAPARASGGGTVLLVEDEAPVRRLCRRVLESNGFIVLEASSGEEGLRIAIDHDGPLDVVLTDVVMPGMSGAEMVRRLQRYRADFAPIYSSGYADDAIARHGVITPGENFLQKPFTPELLLASVRRVLSSPEP